MIDQIFARHPLHAGYWAMIAPTLYAFVIVGVSILLSEDVAEIIRMEREGAAQLAWTIYVMVNFAVLYRLMRWTERMQTGYFGGSLRVDPVWLWIAAGAAPFIMPTVHIVINAVTGLTPTEMLSIETEQRQMFSPGAAGLSMAMAVIVLAPLIEEIGFRGVALGCLLGRGAPPIVAAIATSAAFAVLHTQYTLVGMIPVFVLGLFLAWLRIASGGIAAPIVAHMAANALPIALLALNPGG